MRIAQEINLLYTDIRQAMTNLTDRQTVIHNHYAKIIRNPAMMIAIVTRITTVMMMITTVSLTEICFTAIAMNQASNDNCRHQSVNFLKKYRQPLKNRKQYYALVPFL